MCGIIGIAKRDGQAAIEAYDGLLMLQHRGQDAAGIVSYDQGQFHEKRDNGLIKDVFKSTDMARLQGNMALGHCRYPTAGGADASEAQPFFVNAPLGMYLIHNGNLTNAHQLREKVAKEYYRHLRTGSDTEVLLNIFATKIYDELKAKTEPLTDAIFSAITNTMNEVTGAYSIISIIDELGLVAFRDPKGIRPLLMGRKMTTRGIDYMFASEDVALTAIGYEVVRDVKPGEAVIVTHDGESLTRECVKGELSPCIFEYVYLARPDSVLNGISVYKTQLRMGSALAKQVAASGLQIDSIIPVPDSSRPVALQMATDLGIPYREGLIKNRYVGRTFIMPGQAARKRSIRQKLSPVELEFKGKNVLLVDDSIVRGNTMQQIVAMCRDAGAKKIYVASGAPPVRFPDVYGVDIPTRKELLAYGMETEDVRKVLGVDALFYQSVNDLVAAAKAGNPEIEQFCTGCFDGGYVTPEVTEEYLNYVENQGRGTYTAAEPHLINI